MKDTQTELVEQGDNRRLWKIAFIMFLIELYVLNHIL
jgi:hypothetical protein